MHNSRLNRLMLTQRFQEGQSRVIDLASVDQDECGDNPHSIKLMIDFFYHSTYDPRDCKTWYEYLNGCNATAPITAASTEEQDDTNKPAGTCVQAEGKDENVANSSNKKLVMHAELYALGSKYQISGLREKACDNFANDVSDEWAIDDLVKAIETTFTKITDSDGRFQSIVRNACVERVAWLIDNKDFRSVVESIDGLGLQLFDDLFRQGEGFQTRQCAMCGTFSRSKCAEETCCHGWKDGGSMGYYLPWHCDLGICSECREYNAHY